MGEDGNLIGKKGEDGELIGKKVYTLQFNKDKKNKVTIFKNQMEITNINMVELVEMDKINKKKILELKKKEDERQKNIKQLKEEYLKRPIDEWVNEFKDKDYYVDMIKGNKNINWNLKFEKIKIPKLPQRKSGKEIIYLKNLNQVLTSDYLMENFDGTDDIFICTEDANKRSRGWTEEGIKNIEELKELVKKAGELMDAKSKERIKQLKKEKDNTEKFDKLFEIVKLKDKIDKIQDILGDLDVKNITPKIENDNIILKITVIKKKDLFSISFDEKTPLYFNYDMSKMKNLFKKKFSKSSFKTNEMKLIISNNFNDKMYLVNRLKKIHENVINNLFEIYEKEEKDKELFGDDFVIFDDEDNKKTYPVIFKYDEGQRKVIHKKDMIYLKEKKIYYCPKDKLKDLEEEKQKKIIEEEKKNYEDAENIKEWKLFNINDILNKDKDIKSNSDLLEKSIELEYKQWTIKMKLNKENYSDIDVKAKEEEYVNQYGGGGDKKKFFIKISALEEAYKKVRNIEWFEKIVANYESSKYKKIGLSDDGSLFIPINASSWKNLVGDYWKDGKEEKENHFRESISKEIFFNNNGKLDKSCFIDGEKTHATILNFDEHCNYKFIDRGIEKNISTKNDFFELRAGVEWGWWQIKKLVKGEPLRLIGHYSDESKEKENHFKIVEKLITEGLYKNQDGIPKQDGIPVEFPEKDFYKELKELDGQDNKSDYIKQKFYGNEKLGKMNRVFTFLSPLPPSALKLCWEFKEIKGFNKKAWIINYDNENDDEVDEWKQTNEYNIGLKKGDILTHISFECVSTDLQPKQQIKLKKQVIKLNKR